jgi:hypothetical protein
MKEKTPIIIKKIGNSYHIGVKFEDGITIIDSHDCGNIETVEIFTPSISNEIITEYHYRSIA